jgi:hypothetical protein
VIFGKAVELLLKNQNIILVRLVVSPQEQEVVGSGPRQGVRKFDIAVLWLNLYCFVLIGVKRAS